MSPAPSRLLIQLDAQIAAADDPFAADCLRAERACYLARQGRFQDARITLDMLRERYAIHPRASMSAWLSLAEGLMIYFLDMNPRSRDRVLRAYAISGAAGLSSLHALSAAWLAQMDFARLNLESMAHHVNQALKIADLDHHAARSRASLVVAQALHTAGRMDLALPWYERTRAHALEAGDDAAISALIHNMAGNQLDSLRLTKLTGRTDFNVGKHAMLGNKSTAHFDRMIGASSLDILNPIRSAQILSLLGEPTRALALYEEHMAAGIDQGLRRLQSDLLSDQAWCRVRVGQHDAARADAVAAEGYLIPETQIDDKAATHSRLALVYAGLGEEERARRHENLAAEAWKAFGQLQNRILELLSAMTVRGAPQL
jgi:tetratricopeptide (TPR) repeat protein